jgi:hypothetical protein
MHAIYITLVCNTECSPHEVISEFTIYVCKSAPSNCYDTLSTFKSYLHKTYPYLTATDLPSSHSRLTNIFHITHSTTYLFIFCLCSYSYPFFLLFYTISSSGTTMHDLRQCSKIHLMTSYPET